MAKKGPASMEDRIHRIQGQLKGVENLLANGEFSEKTIYQIDAVTSSLNSLKLELVKKQIRDKILAEFDAAVNLLK